MAGIVQKNNLHVSVKCHLTILLVVNVKEEQMHIQCRWNNTDRKNQIAGNKNLSNWYFILQKSKLECPGTETETQCWENEEEMPEL